MVHEQPRGTSRRTSELPIRKLRLGEEELVDPRDASTVDERVALVRQLTREAWATAGLEIPSYARGETPGRVIRPAR
ncbi:MAG: hypothetical protein K1X94_25525 [Sandaracinaceae bacterium]|nr:hypothetical protein [Sandaracinaceae bacterium]